MEREVEGEKMKENRQAHKKPGDQISINKKEMVTSLPTGFIV